MEHCRPWYPYEPFNDCTFFTRWRHQMETFSASLALCEGNKRLNKQARHWWFETPSRPLWRHGNGVRSWQLIRSAWWPITNIFTSNNRYLTNSAYGSQNDRGNFITNYLLHFRYPPKSEHTVPTAWFIHRQHCCVWLYLGNIVSR